MKFGLGNDHPIVQLTSIDTHSYRYFFSCDENFFFFFKLFLNLFIYLFIYSWLCWVLASARGLSPVAASGGHPPSRSRASHRRGLSRRGAQAPDAHAQQSWLTGPVAPRHVGSSQTRARTCVPRIGRQTLNHCATREALVMRTFKIYSLSNFQVYNTVLLTMVTMLYTTSLGLIHLIIRGLHLLTIFPCFTHPPLQPLPLPLPTTNLFSLRAFFFFQILHISKVV